jgi:hypothetical protein
MKFTAGQIQECPDGSSYTPMSPREVAIAKSELTARPTGILGKLLCRFGKHDLQTLRLDHNTLNGGMPSGALYECRRCGQVQEWVAAWDQACCIGKWPTLRAFLDTYPTHKSK